MPLVYSPELGRIIEMSDAEFAAKTAPPVPYIGAIVHYVHPALDDSPQCHAAIVTEIRPDGRLKLTFFKSDERELRLDPIVSYSENHAAEFCWHWPHLPEITP